MTDPISLLFAGGVIGYAIGRDGKTIVPVTPRHLQESKPSFEKKIEIDTSEARDNQLYNEAGNLIYVVNPAIPTSAVYIKFNEPEESNWELTKLRKIKFPFYRFWITNEAGEGILEIRVARGLQVEPYEGVVQSTLTMKLNDVTDVEVPSPSDNDLLKYNQATGKWEDEALKAAELPAHKTRHQDGGADEISIAGLAGEPADTVNKTGDQTIAGIKTFSSIPVLPASDPTADNEATRKAYVDGKAAVPSGGIIIWHGTIASIPSGYVICDGNNSTPNLLAKFVEGIADAETDPGATGGAKSKTTSGHQHDGPISFNAAGNDLNVKASGAFGTGAAISTDKIFDATNVEHSDAAHKVKSNTDSISDIRPAYYDVAFIMKT